MKLNQFFPVAEATRKEKQISLADIEKKWPEAAVTVDRDIAPERATFYLSNFHPHIKTDDVLVCNAFGKGWFEYDANNERWRKIEKPALARGGEGRGGGFMGLGSHQDIRSSRGDNDLGTETVRKVYGSKPIKALQRLGIDPENCVFEKNDDRKLQFRIWDAEDNPDLPDYGEWDEDLECWIGAAGGQLV